MFQDELRQLLDDLKKAAGALSAAIIRPEEDRRQRVLRPAPEVAANEESAEAGSEEVADERIVPLGGGSFLVVRFAAPGIMRLSRAVQDRIGDLSARAQESFAGARVVRAYATEDVEIAAFSEANSALVQETIGLARRRAVMQGAVYALGGLGQLSVLYVGGRMVIGGELAFGDLGAFLAYVAMLVWPMISVGWVVSALQRAAAAIQRIDEVMTEPVEESVRTPPPDCCPADLNGDRLVDVLDFFLVLGAWDQ